jgi:hypothetical protein
LYSKAGIGVKSFGEVESSTIKDISQTRPRKIYRLFSPSIILQSQVKSLGSNIVTKKQLIVEQDQFVQIKRLYSLKSAVAKIISPSRVQRIAPVDRRIPVPKIESPVLSYSLTSNLEQMTFQRFV